MPDERTYLAEMAESGYAPDAIDLYHRRMIPWLLDRHGIPRAARIVDIGAGSGHIIIPLHEAGWTDLVAVDIDDRNFALFRDRYGVETVPWDATDGPLALPDASAQAVTCFHVIEHLPRPDNLLVEAWRVLAPGGTLFIATPDWRKCVLTFFDDPTHLRPYTKTSIRRILRQYGFEMTTHSWNTRFGLGRLKLYRWWPRTAMIGVEMLAVGRKPG